MSTVTDQFLWGCTQKVWSHINHISGGVQDCSNSSALAMELLQSCAKPSISSFSNYSFLYFHSIVIIIGCHWDRQVFWSINLPLFYIYALNVWMMYSMLKLNTSLFNILRPGPRFNIKMSFYQYRKSHCGDKTILTTVLSPQWDFLYSVSPIYRGWWGPWKGTAI